MQETSPTDSNAPATQPTLVKNIIILIDHDNLDVASTNPRAIVTSALRAVPDVADGVSVILRAYGGWFEGNSPTESRFRALLSYHDLCPALIRTHTGLVRISFEFADELALTRKRRTKVDVRYTVTVRRTADRIVGCRSSAACGEADCEIHKVRQWIRKRKACFSPTCPHPFEDFFQRRQQKQVDVHLAVDLIWFASTCPEDTRLVVASDDVDLLPALLHAGSENQRRPLVRLHRRGGPLTYPDILFAQLGIIDLELTEDPQQ